MATGPPSRGSRPEAGSTRDEVQKPLHARIIVAAEELLWRRVFHYHATFHEYDAVGNVLSEANAEQHVEPPDLEPYRDIDPQVCPAVQHHQVVTDSAFTNTDRTLNGRGRIPDYLWQAKKMTHFAQHVG